MGNAGQQGNAGNQPGSSNPPGQGGTNPPGGEKPPAATFEEFLAAQPDEVKTLYEAHNAGLKSALDKERDNNKALAKQLRDATSKMEEGSEARKSLEKIGADLETATRRADFYEAATQAGVRNLKLAWVVATTDDLFDKKGNVNFETMKKDYPELFEAKQIPPGHAGSGQGQGNQTRGMNDLIREAAGRK